MLYIRIYVLWFRYIQTPRVSVAVGYWFFFFFYSCLLFPSTIYYYVLYVRRYRYLNLYIPFNGRRGRDVVVVVVETVSRRVIIAVRFVRITRIYYYGGQEFRFKKKKKKNTDSGSRGGGRHAGDPSPAYRIVTIGCDAVGSSRRRAR